MKTQTCFIPLTVPEEKKFCATGCEQPARWVLANSIVVCDACLFSFLGLLQHDPFLSNEEYAACFRDYVGEWLPRHLAQCRICQAGSSVRLEVLKAVVKAPLYRSAHWRS